MHRFITRKTRPSKFAVAESEDLKQCPVCSLYFADFQMTPKENGKQICNSCEDNLIKSMPDYYMNEYMYREDNG